jgi:HD-GYP domain-containing protein (c-di-GMP phosphodiesterase class II)
MSPSRDVHVPVPPSPKPEVGPTPTRERTAGLIRSVVDSGYPNVVLDRLARQTCEVIGVERSCIVARDDADPTKAVAVAGHGVRYDVVGTRFANGVGEEIQRSCGVDPVATSNGRTKRGGTAVSAPIMGSDGVVEGALSAGTMLSRTFAPKDLALLSELAGVVGAALSHAARRSELRSTLRDRIGAAAAAIDEHDGYTAGHSERVLELSRAVGERLGLGRADLVELELAALLHDVGKIAVPAALLAKPGPLDENEVALIRAHPIWGAQLLAGVPGLEAVAVIVRFHHERWDGQGYPEGLAGERIPLASRIVAACDAYHAMTSDRPYRLAAEKADALRELDGYAGSQFDPTVVEALTATVTGDGNDSITKGNG